MQSARLNWLGRGSVMLPWLGGALLRPLNARTFAAASAAAASSGLHFCIVGSGPAGFYTADKVSAVITSGKLKQRVVGMAAAAHARLLGWSAACRPALQTHEHQRPGRTYARMHGTPICCAAAEKVWGWRARGHCGARLPAACSRACRPKSCLFGCTPGWRLSSVSSAHNGPIPGQSVPLDAKSAIACCHRHPAAACAQLLLRRAPLQEALPTPFGLVRSGVAPDHADTKVGGADGRCHGLGGRGSLNGWAGQLWCAGHPTRALIEARAAGLQATRPACPACRTPSWRCPPHAAALCLPCPRACRPCRT